MTRMYELFDADMNPVIHILDADFIHIKEELPKEVRRFLDKWFTFFPCVKKGMFKRGEMDCFYEVKD